MKGLSEEVLDAKLKVLHNLFSLLLTNKTIRGKALKVLVRKVL